MKIEGGCHCGLVRFEAYVEGPEVALLSCDCSIGRMTGYLHLILPEEKVRLVEGQRETSTYRFGTGRARHIFCSNCRIESFYRPRSHPDGTSINWHRLDEGHGLTAAIAAFDGVYPA